MLLLQLLCINHQCFQIYARPCHTSWHVNAPVSADPGVQCPICKSLALTTLCFWYHSLLMHILAVLAASQHTTAGQGCQPRLGGCAYTSHTYGCRDAASPARCSLPALHHRAGTGLKAISFRRAANCGRSWPSCQACAHGHLCCGRGQRQVHSGAMVCCHPDFVGQVDFGGQGNCSFRPYAVDTVQHCM